MATAFEIKDTDLNDFNADVSKHLRDMGVSMQFIGRDMMRAYVNNIIKLTFPATKREGDNAIKRDMDKIFARLDNPDVLAFFNTQFGDGSATKSGKIKGKKRQAEARRILPGVKFNWDGNQGKISGWHNKHRRRGRVVKRPRVVANIGKWQFSDKMYLTRTAYNRHLRMKLKSVGKLKSGWMPASRYFSKVTGGASLQPAYARRHSGNGTYTDGFDEKGNGVATATNKITYSDRLTKWILTRAQMKTNAYADKITKKQAEKIVDRFNAQRAGVAA